MSLSKIVGLDILRTVAILSVVIGHGKPILQKAGSLFPFIRLPDGVEIFFCVERLSHRTNINAQRLDFIESDVHFSNAAMAAHFTQLLFVFAAQHYFSLFCFYKYAIKQF